MAAVQGNSDSEAFVGDEEGQHLNFLTVTHLLRYVTN